MIYPTIRHAICWRHVLLSLDHIQKPSFMERVMSFSSVHKRHWHARYSILALSSGRLLICTNDKLLKGQCFVILRPYQWDQNEHLDTWINTNLRIYRWEFGRLTLLSMVFGGTVYVFEVVRIGFRGKKCCLAVERWQMWGRLISSRDRLQGCRRMARMCRIENDE